jgi:hypothetical protein
MDLHQQSSDDIVNLNDVDLIQLDGWVLLWISM